MGTQQILMIILSVIVVGTAIAVGIQMFDTQLENQARQALAAELMQQAAQLQAWYRTPIMMGGGGNGYDPATHTALTAFTQDQLNSMAKFIQRDVTGNNPWDYRNMHGSYNMTFTAIAGTATTGLDGTVIINATSDVNSDIQVRCTVTLSQNTAGIVIVQVQ